MSSSDRGESAVARTRRWIESVVIGLSFCPFAKRELDAGSVRLWPSDATEHEDALVQLLAEWHRMDEDASTATALLIFVQGFTDFDRFWDLVQLANGVLADQDYEGIYQLASFHPDYLFADAPTDDPANYTNRSPYPMLQVLREDSVASVLASYPSPELIPQRNVTAARAMGPAKLQALLDQCIGAPSRGRSDTLH